MISSSRTGRRRQANGQRIGKGSIVNYQTCLRLLKVCENTTGIKWQLFATLKINQSLHRRQRIYWERFYRVFTDLLYARGYHDNYVAGLLKVIRTLLHWLYRQYGYADYQYLPYQWIRTEQIPIVTISPLQFQFLINDKAFENSLSPAMHRIKDIFVFGCTVGLRYGDLIALKKQNLVEENGQTCLVVLNHKTKFRTRMALPPFALSIVDKYNRGNRLLPLVSNAHFNLQIKKLAELAGWTNVLGKYRCRRGVPHCLIPKNKMRQPHRFCDLVTAHTMRRSAVSNLLQLGVPEYLVKQVSGHAPTSKEFYRYVDLSQKWKDQHIEDAFRKLEPVI